MNQYFFIQNKYFKKIISITVITIFFGFYEIAFLTNFFFFMTLFFLRQRTFVLNDLRLAEPNLILSPVSGFFLKEEKKENKTVLVFRIKFYNCSGLYLPVNGEIIYSDENKIQIENKKGSLFTIFAKGLSSINRPRYFIKPGDRGLVGALFGHFPLGGKVYLEIPSDCEVMIRRGDRVLSSQTIVAKIKD